MVRRHFEKIFDKRKVSNFDRSFFIALFALMAIGLVAVFSATNSMGGGTHGLFKRQILWMGVGLTLMTIAINTNYVRLLRWGYHLYGLAVVLLLLVMLMGHSGMGAQRWLPLGPFQFQPSELAKLCLIITLAKYFSEDGETNGHTLRQLMKPALLLFVPFILVVKQPDLGTGMMLAFIFCAIVIAAGVKMRSFMLLVVAFIIILPLSYKIAWNHLKDYQKKRLIVFINPESDPAGSGYHIIQSKIAVGSGGLTGKGYLAGTQSQLHFLPERHTDFIFSVISEEWGFAGSITVLLVFLFLILWGLETAYKAKDRFGALIAVGVTAMLFFHVIVNIGMTIGIMPVVGVPLPLVSYGGTSAMMTLAALGLLASVNLRRFRLFY